MPRRSSETATEEVKNGQNWAKNANDHEQRVRVHPALPSYFVVVPAPELSSIDVAVVSYMGMVRTLSKRALPRQRQLIRHFPDYRPSRSGRGLSRLHLSRLSSGRPGRLAKLPDRPIRERRHQHDSGHDSPQKPRN